MEKIIVPLITVLLSGGFFGGIYALLKLRPEAGQLTVVAAQGAVLVQTGVIDDLREEMQRLKDQIKELRIELNQEREDNKQLRVRISELEKNNGS